jgi:hypothetical protein
MVARKRDFAMLASSARRRASSEFALACSSSAKSASFSARDCRVATALHDEEQLCAHRHHGEHKRVDAGLRRRDEQQHHADHERREPCVDGDRDRRRQHGDDSRQHDEHEEHECAGAGRLNADERLHHRGPADAVQQLPEHEAAAPGAQRDGFACLAQEPSREARGEPDRTEDDK